MRTELTVAGMSEVDPARDRLIVRLRELAGELPLAWTATTSRVPVENCVARWRFQCPKMWTQLTPTDEPEVRFCSACRRNVYYCHTIEDARTRAGESGECVAINVRVARQPGDLAPEYDILGELEDEDGDSEVDDPEFADG